MLEKVHNELKGSEKDVSIFGQNLQMFKESGGVQENIALARKVYEDANQRLREDATKNSSGDDAQSKEFRLMLLESWRDFELENQDGKCIKKVANLMPKRVKKRRRIQQDEDAPGELFIIYIALPIVLVCTPHL